MPLNAILQFLMIVIGLGLSLSGQGVQGSIWFVGSIIYGGLFQCQSK